MGLLLQSWGPGEWCGSQSLTGSSTLSGTFKAWSGLCPLRPQVFRSACSSGRIYPRQVSIADEKETEAQPKEVVVQGHAGPEGQGKWQANIQTSWRLHSSEETGSRQAQSNWTEGAVDAQNMSETPQEEILSELIMLRKESLSCSAVPYSLWLHRL